MDDFRNDSGGCLGHQTAEPSIIAGNSLTQAKPEANLADDSSNDYLEQPQPVVVRPRLSPPDMEFIPPEGRRPLPQRFPLGQHHVHPGEGRPLPSNNVRRDPQQGQEVPVVIEESPVSLKIALMEPASTISPQGPRTSSLGEERPLSPNLSQITSLEAGQLSLRPFPPGLGNSPPGEGRPLPPPNACSDPEPGFREPAALGRGKSPRIV